MKVCWNLLTKIKKKKFGHVLNGVSVATNTQQIHRPPGELNLIHYTRNFSG